MAQKLDIYLQNFQFAKTLKGLLVQAHDLVVVQLKAAQRRGATKHFPAHSGEGIMGQVAGEFSEKLRCGLKIQVLA